ncbi:hypothetical protein SELMODRAFT_421561 [Selaginella moellendorffii]|uniref:Purple acid phosphatase C-terminal domain-containing protein n=1 Tax=Selaginella moellendorffii TaxID=88036 RepID=D8SFN2_SELML|nr:hypothetical protein SELMODRAFT_421561 [Selaginella moellendorffii]
MRASTLSSMAMSIPMRGRTELHLRAGPALYIVVGDGGNIKRVDTEHADDPGKCPKPEDNVFRRLLNDDKNSNAARFGHIVKAAGMERPAALRDGSFGHGLLEVKNNTHALWTWYRNQDVHGDSHLGDIVKSPQCRNYPAFQADERSGGNSGSPSRILGALAILMATLLEF